MNTLKFKTNINCSGCQAKVTPFLDESVGKENWEVNTQTPDKILTVTTNEINESDIINTLKKAGFVAEIINS
jgi:copper chaperone